MASSPKTTTTENKPPAWAAPLFSQSASEAQKLYNSGKGGNVYQGDTTAGLGTTTQSGISGLQGAVAGIPQTTSSANNLSDIASGSFLKNGNPYFESALGGQLQSTADQVQSQFSGSGRYGSGANTNVLTNALGDIRSKALYNQYNQDTQNMLTANNQIDSANNALLNSQLAGNQAVIQAGQLQDAAKQAELDAAQSKFLAEDNKDWTRLGLLQAAASGSAGNYGSQSQVQSGGGNGLLSAIGGIGSLATK